MTQTRALVTASILFAALLSTSAASATPVTGTLAASYFQVVEGSPDFPGGTPIVPDGSSLVNGMPYVTGGALSVGPGGALQWWTTANPYVSSTGTGTITLPYGSNMFAPNSTGSNNSQYFETAMFAGTFSLASPGTVNFTIGSDDDTFVYLNGILIGQNPGIHATTYKTFETTANAGPNFLQIFYADRQRVDAYLSIDADVALTAAVPEPSTWAMMILGFFGIGFMTYRQRKNMTFRAA
jgi:hypothetical protein